MRYLSQAIEEILSSERKMCFVCGPRQVGKTTVAQALLASPERGYFNWDVDGQRRAILRDPDRFWATGAEAGAHRTRIVLDEIHKYPRWKRFLKGLFDGHRDTLEVLVTGSGRLDVYQKGGDSLLGRYDLFHLHPFTVGELLARGHQTVLSPAELGERIEAPGAVPGASEGLDLIERFTGFPEPLFAAQERRMQRWRRSRRQLVLREDLRDLSRIRDVGLVDSLVALLPERVGSPISINALREDLQVAFDTVRGWLVTLERLYFLFALRPFAGKLGRTLRREEKVYLFDHTEIEDAGARFENLVALHLQKLADVWNDLGYGDFALWYVRDKEKREVDFLLTDRKKPFLLVEAKLSDNQPSPALRYFAERLKPRWAIQVVRRGDPRTGPVGVVPADRFLSWI